MLNLSDITKVYIETSIGEFLSPSVYTSFRIMQDFSLMYFEDKYVELLHTSQESEPDSVRDKFISYIRKDLNDILIKHGIGLDYDTDVSLSELNEICSFLIAVQNLDDYELVYNICNSFDSDKETLVELLDVYSNISTIRCMEIIASVKHSLIEAIYKLSQTDETETDTETSDRDHKRIVDRFRAFIGGHVCLGIELYDRGYSKLTLTELDNLSTTYIADYVKESLKKDATQTALDVLSLLLVTVDNYEDPIEKLKENGDMFTTDTSVKIKLVDTVSRIYIDFKTYLDKGKAEDDNKVRVS